MSPIAKKAWLPLVASVFSTAVVLELPPRSPATPNEKVVAARPSSGLMACIARTARSSEAKITMPRRSRRTTGMTANMSSPPAAPADRVPAAIGVHDGPDEAGGVRRAGGRGRRAGTGRGQQHEGAGSQPLHRLALRPAARHRVLHGAHDTTVSEDRLSL